MTAEADLLTFEEEVPCPKDLVGIHLELLQFNAEDVELHAPWRMCAALLSDCRWCVIILH